MDELPGRQPATAEARGRYVGRGVLDAPGAHRRKLLCGPKAAQLFFSPIDLRLLGPEFYQLGRLAQKILEYSRAPPL